MVKGKDKPENKISKNNDQDMVESLLGKDAQSYDNLDYHKPVLIDEVIEALGDSKIVVDCTFGAGGYSLGLLNANPDLKVIAIDRDSQAIERGQRLIEERKLNNRLTLLYGKFSEIDSLLDSINIHQGEIDSIVMDLGVSSPQLDDAERGFSFKNDGPLDMCMGLCEYNAAYVVNNFSEQDIANIIYKYGDERKSRRIAKKIVEQRAEKSFETTKELADLVRSVVGFERKGFDPATRTFQALRIFVNREMEELESVLYKSIKMLKPGGKLVCVTFHSGEDRIVKHFIKEYSGQNAPAISRYMPEAVLVNGSDSDKDAGQVYFERARNKPTAPSKEEQKYNIRARSAKMRVAIRNKVTFVEKGASPDETGGN